MMLHFLTETTSTRERHITPRPIAGSQFLEKVSDMTEGSRKRHRELMRKPISGDVSEIKLISRLRTSN